MQRISPFLILLFFCSFCDTSHAKTNIYWFSESAAQLAKPNSSNSITNDTTQLLMAALPQYQFSIEFAQSPSIARLLKKLPDSCAPNRVKTPARLTENIYSLPLNITLALRLYYKESASVNSLPQSAFNKDQQLISLTSLFTGKSNYTLGVAEGRSFGVFIDEQIAKVDKHNLVIRTGDKPSFSLVNMLLKNRIDYLIDFPTSVKAALNSSKKPMSLNSVEIAGSPGYIVGHIACSKSDLGEQVIADIDKALLKLYSSYPFYQAHIRYFDKADIAEFNRAYQAVFRVDIPVKSNS